MESNSNNGNGLLDRLFHIKQLNTSVRTEVLAGFTTFLAMCYIIIVNPSILAMTGMDQGAVFVATCLAAALGCMVMGLVANYPIALAPGMGLNTYFTFSVCMGMGVPWQTALAAVFVSGVVFLFVSLFKFREAMINAIPMSLKLAIAGGIGLFLALIALKSSGVVIANEPTLIKMGDLSSASVLFAALGFLLIVVMHHFKVRGAIIISILAITMLSTLTGHNEFKGVFGEIPSLAPTFMQMDFEGLFTASMIGVIFVFFLVDLFDSTGTLVGVSQRAGLLVDGKLPRLKRALMADSSAIIAGAALGTSSTTPYTALLYVGVLMVHGITGIDWDDITEAVPAFLTMTFMPFTYSIADGIAIGFISYALVKLLTGKAKAVPYMVWIIAIVWAIKFAIYGG